MGADKTNNRSNQIIAICFAVFSFIVSLFVWNWHGVDDYLVSLVLNGMYSSDNYCLFVNPVLCWLVKTLRHIIPGADCYLLFVRLCSFISYYSISIVCLRRFPRRITFPLLITLCLISFSSLNYTTVTVFFIVSGLISIFDYLYSETKSKATLIIGSVLIFAGFILRQQSALLMIPFFILELAAFLFTHKKSLKQCVIPVSVVMGIIVLTSGVNLYYQSLYESNIYYNDMRTKLCDYPNKSWEEVSSELPNMTENDYGSLHDFLLADTNRIDGDYLASVAEVSAKPINLDLGYAFRVIRAYVVLDWVTLYVLIAAIALVVLSLSSHTTIVDKVKVVLSVLGGTIILIYFAMSGRVQSRVVTCVLLLVILSCLISMFESKTPKRIELISFINLGTLALGVVLLLTLVMRVALISDNPPYFAFNAYSDNFEHTSSCEDGDALYIWGIDEYDQTLILNSLSRGKAFSSDEMYHNIPIGEWTYGQQYMYDFLSMRGITNPIAALVNRSDVYYVGENPMYVEVYLSEHYDFDGHASRCGDIDGVPVWQFIAE